MKLSQGRGQLQPVSPDHMMYKALALQKKLSALESFRRRFFTKSNLSMGIGWLVFLLLVLWASKHGGTETQFFDPYEILQVGCVTLEKPLTASLLLIERSCNVNCC